MTHIPPASAFAQGEPSAGTVSVVVSCRDNETTILPCLASVKALAGSTPVELVVVIGPSTDRTAEIARDFVAAEEGAFSRVSIEHDPGSSLSLARRIGGAVATGDPIVFLDGDMFVSADFGGALSAAMIGRDVIAPRIRVLRVDAATRSFGDFLDVFDVFTSRLGGGGVVPQVRVYRAEALRRMGGYPLLSKFFAEDRLATRYSILLGLRYAYEPALTLVKADSPGFISYFRKHRRYGKGIHTDLTASGASLLRGYVIARRLAYLDLPLPVASSVYLAASLARRGRASSLPRVMAAKWLIDAGMLAGDLGASLARSRR
jgi:glycosyltransferase involved in cell wall biosynthesis